MKAEWPVALLPLRTFLAKHHAVLFISLISLLLALAIYILYTTSTATAPDDPTSSIGQFDKETIDKIKNLHDSTDSTNTLDFPKPRSNPFTE